MTVDSSPGSGDASTNAHDFSASQRRMSQPSEARFRRMSSGVSSNVTKTPLSTCLAIPSARNWAANTVLALPAVPATSVVRPLGSPPYATRSKPGIPVRCFSI